MDEDSVPRRQLRGERTAGCLLHQSREARENIPAVRTNHTSWRGNMDGARLLAVALHVSQCATPLLVPARGGVRLGVTLV
eukprot:6345160-Pyramimonas_sp.AAC.2